MSDYPARTAAAIQTALVGGTGNFGKFDNLYGAPTNPGRMHLGLTNQDPASFPTPAEPTGGSYARVLMDTVDWQVNEGTPAGGSTMQNQNTLSFNTATADWLAGANLTHWVLFDNSTTGNIIMYGTLTTPKPVANGDTPRFDPGELQHVLT